MATAHVPAHILLKSRALTAAQFQGLDDVPPELEWFANLLNEKTRRAYQRDITEFGAFVGIHHPEEFRRVTRAHVIAWRKDFERRQLSPATIRRKLSALSSLFEYLCERNTVAHNPVKGVKRPRANHNEGTTPALSDDQARALLKAPPTNTLKGLRDRAILATLLYHGPRREELCKLRVRDYQRREGILHFRVEGKGDKVRFIPVGIEAQLLIYKYLKASQRGEDLDGPLFRPMKNNTTGELRKPLYPSSVYHNIVRRYGNEVGIALDVHGFCVHSLRATAATNALAHDADIKGLGVAWARQYFDHAPV